MLHWCWAFTQHKNVIDVGEPRQFSSLVSRNAHERETRAQKKLCWQIESDTCSRHLIFSHSGKLNPSTPGLLLSTFIRKTSVKIGSFPHSPLLASIPLARFNKLIDVSAIRTANKFVTFDCAPKSSPRQPGIIIKLFARWRFYEKFRDVSSPIFSLFFMNFHSRISIPPPTKNIHKPLCSRRMRHMSERGEKRGNKSEI